MVGPPAILQTPWAHPAQISSWLIQTPMQKTPSKKESSLLNHSHKTPSYSRRPATNVEPQSPLTKSPGNAFGKQKMPEWIGKQSNPTHLRYAALFF